VTRLNNPVDRSIPPPEGGFAADFSDLVVGSGRPSDIRVTKHQWGAFYGTDLDGQLRRRGIKTILLGGIATNLGVESTARQAHEAGYEVVLVEDVTTSLSADMHAFAVDAIFPMLSRVLQMDEMHLTTK
jgi:nicotinamidase-related amidase